MTQPDLDFECYGLISTVENRGTIEIGAKRLQVGGLEAAFV